MTRFAAYVLIALSMVTLAACEEKNAQASAEEIAGVEWIAEDIGGKGIIDNSRVTIAFDNEGRVSGHSGCNRYTGGYKYENGVLTFPAAMASTRMACLAEAVAKQEQDYLNILTRVEKAEISADKALILKSADGDTLTFRVEAVSEAPPAE